MRPAVPEYCRRTPTDFVPFLTNPVSSSTSTPSASPNCATAYARRACPGAGRGHRALDRHPSACAQENPVPRPASIPGALGQLPAVLALHRSKQALQIGPYPPARLNPAKTRRDLLDQRIQLTRPIDSFIHCGHDHASMAAQFITAIPAVVLERLTNPI